MICSEDVRRFWDGRAREFKTSGQATLRETRLREREIRAIIRHLPDRCRAIDIGCGNGYSTLRFAQARKLDIVGVDFSPEMIRYARENLVSFQEHNPRKSVVDFGVADVLDLRYPAESFDVAITERCLQNLTSWEDQRQAIVNIGRLLKPDGRFIMTEGSFTSLDRLVGLTHRLGLKEPAGVVPWHNLFFCDDLLLNDPAIRRSFVPIEIDNFASSYMLVTRLLSARLHRLAGVVPNFGSFGYIKIYSWRRRR